MYYQEVFNILNKFKVRYLVVGGLAVVLHGFVRFTSDLDIMVDFDKKNLLNFFAALKALGYKPKLPVKVSDFSDDGIRKNWIKNKNMKVFSFIHSKMDYKLIDVFAEEVIPFSRAYRRRQVVKAENTPINIISFDDLITLKKLSARCQDLDDIKMLEELKEEYENKKRKK